MKGVGDLNTRVVINSGAWVSERAVCHLRNHLACE